LFNLIINLTHESVFMFTQLVVVALLHLVDALVDEEVVHVH
jgi:hypothetical protein